MKKTIKFSHSQAELVTKSIDAFKNETVKDVAKSYFGGLAVSHSKGTYTQSYSRNAEVPTLG